jgi:hypothetical protein
MIDDDNDSTMDGGGYDVDDWSRLNAFVAVAGPRVAGLDDVQAGVAVFSLADTLDPRPIDMPLPQPLIWWDEDGEQAAVAVQAERHHLPDGEAMDVLGVILPDGGSAVALLEDVDLVDDTDPTWRALVASAISLPANDD